MRLLLNDKIPLLSYTKLIGITDKILETSIDGAIDLWNLIRYKKEQFLPVLPGSEINDCGLYF